MNAMKRRKGNKVSLKKYCSALHLLFIKTKFNTCLKYNAIKAPQRYAVQGSDTTMMLIAASLPEQ